MSLREKIAAINSRSDPEWNEKAFNILLETVMEMQEQNADFPKSSDPPLWRGIDRYTADGRLTVAGDDQWWKAKPKEPEKMPPLWAVIDRDTLVCNIYKDGISSSLAQTIPPASRIVRIPGEGEPSAVINNDTYLKVVFSTSLGPVEHKCRWEQLMFDLTEKKCANITRIEILPESNP